MDWSFSQQVGLVAVWRLDSESGRKVALWHRESLGWAALYSTGFLQRDDAVPGRNPCLFFNCTKGRSLDFHHPKYLLMFRTQAPKSYNYSLLAREHPPPPFTFVLLYPSLHSFYLQRKEKTKYSYPSGINKYPNIYGKQYVHWQSPLWNIWGQIILEFIILPISERLKDVFSINGILPTTGLGEEALSDQTHEYFCTGLFLLSEAHRNCK